LIRKVEDRALLQLECLRHCEDALYEAALRFDSIESVTYVWRRACGDPARLFQLRKGHLMLSRLTAPATSRLSGGDAQSKSAKGVTELLAELAEVRVQKAELEKREAAIVTAARARLVQERQALEGLKKKVAECGIEVNDDWAASSESAEPHKLAVTAK